ncbi:reverse transcriptase domain-containing protein [Microseira wollei]|uniref:RNA-directed DNA polymerase (Reverse transcriptase) n=1 Tax=Microseira wollei NIES-4236 TaxID=2530354 RepID=A0AAV3X4N8_9CYAN|nr:reverse transcriptase domain-containing protein [Microseira wollei]GET35561.1 RNA-directed DNA polymerase (Reverse transcriptase) [Microseira wollei NIES-4236]
MKQYPKYGYIRYADDFIITAQSEEDIQSILPHIQEWLKQRGLTLNEEKTQIRHIEEGFNFLGFNIRHFDGKCLLKPQKEKVIAKLREVKEWLETNRHTAPSVVIRHLNAVVLGNAFYYKHGVSHKTFEYIDYRMYEMLYKWALKRHPQDLRKKTKGEPKNRGFRVARLTHHLCFWPRVLES